MTHVAKDCSFVVCFLLMLDMMLLAIKLATRKSLKDNKTGNYCWERPEGVVMHHRSIVESEKIEWQRKELQKKRRTVPT